MLAFCSLLALCTAHSAIASTSLEWAVKAEYLFKLPPFIDWPQNAFASSAEPFRLCVVGDDPFGRLLDNGPSVGNRAVAIVRLKSVTADNHCQTMYVNGDPQFVAQSLAAVEGTPVLTVTDTPGAGKGIVNFVMVANRVRIEIDREAALKNHLNISSKLLDIASSPKGNAP